MQSVKVLAKGQVVIPASIRKEYRIQPGSEIQIFEYGNLIYLVPPSEDPVKGGDGLSPGHSLLIRGPTERKKDLVP